MKRSMAFIALVAIVASLFSGIAFAADPVACKISLDQDSVFYSETFATAKITGRILDASSEALRKVSNTIKVYEDANQNGLLDAAEWDDDATDLLYSVAASNGVFELILDTSAHDVANLFVVGADNADATFAAGTEVAFRIVKEMELTEESALEFEFPVSGQVVLQAVYTNEDGASTDTVQIAYIDDNGAIDTVIANANFKGTDEVGFLFTGSSFDHVGEIGLFVNGILMLEGEVVAPELDVDMTDSVPHSLGNQEIEFDFDIDTDYIADATDDLTDGYEIHYTITDEDDAEVVAETVLVDDDGSPAFDDVDKQEVAISIDFDGWEAGEYTVTIQLIEVGTTVVAEVEKTLEVVNPSRYTLMGWNLDDTLGNGAIVIQFPDNGNADLADPDAAPNYEAPVAGAADEQLEVREFVSGSIEHVKYFVVKVTGCGVDEEYTNFGDDAITADANGAITMEIDPESTGTLTITIEAYTDTDEDAAATFTKEIEITGWNMEIDTQSVLVDSEQTIVFTITDEDGNPVNNAIILIDGTVVVDGTSTNIISGVYTYEDDEEGLFDTVQDLNVTVENSVGDVMISDTGAISVIGEEVYTVSSDKDVLLNGIEEVVYVSILDENGDVVYPEFVRIDVDAEGDETTGAAPAVGSRKDLDGDGIKEAVALTITPNADQDEMIIRATTDNGKQMGQVTLDIQKPVVVMTGANKVTENFETSFEFTVIDPRDNSIMENTITIEEASAYIPDVDFTFPTALSADDDNVWTAEVLIKNVNWETAEDEEDTVEISIMMGTVELAVIEVSQASLTSNPEQVIINAATNMTLTYVDADGNVLEGYAITLDGEELGETDENGQLVYATSSTSSLALDFEGATDVAGKVTELTVKSTADTVGPVATAPETVTGDSVVITITDNVRVSKVMVNGKPVDIYFPMAEVTHIATGLQSGANTFVVEAIDINNNYTKTVLTVTKNAPVQFQVGVASEYGIPVLIDGTTMVPVRFAEDLGCTVLWDNTTKTATYSLGETVISVTVGSNTAIINGENVQVTQKPFINELNRVMVPLRMIAQELGFQVNWTSNDAPVTIVK